jgi:UDP-3-O-[3-hydroxymyristoyl] N-acetylglucosamine deacetylase
LNQQRTLKAPVVFSGVGLHTGKDAVVTVSPATEHSGLVFVLAGEVCVPALAEYVVDTSRATVIGRDGVSVSTVEHLLSALVGLGVTNARVAVEGPEIPVLDGSSLVFVKALRETGLQAQEVERHEIRLPELHFTDGDKRVSFLPADEFSVEVTIDFRPPIGRQRFSGALPPEVYEREIAPARTFGYLDELEALRARGLAMGGSLDNAIVFGPDGPLQPLRVEDEPVRHKVLDLLGDFALCGVALRGKIIAHKSGHALHARAVQALRHAVMDMQSS